MAIRDVELGTDNWTFTQLMSSKCMHQHPVRFRSSPERDSAGNPPTPTPLMRHITVMQPLTHSGEDVRLFDEP